MAGELVERSSLVDQSARTPAVLVVDDEVQVRTLLCSALKGWGYGVDMATNGVDALERLAQQPYDVIVTDIHMPRMDGMTLWRRAAGVGYGGAWILMTGLARPSVECVVPVLYKPFQLSELRQMLTHMVPATVI